MSTEEFPLSLENQKNDNPTYTWHQKLGRIAAVGMLTLSGSAVAFAAHEAISPNDAYANTGGYPWHDANHIAQAPNGPAVDNYTWGYIDKTTCDGKSSDYDCSSAKIGNYYFRDQWGFDLRNCTSYVAWRVANDHNASASGMGTATLWDNRAANKGWTVDTTPELGDIAQWEGNDQSPASNPGHVAYVAEIGTGANAGKVRVEEYNQQFTGSFRSNRWVVADKYIDINGTGVGVGAGSGAAASPQFRATSSTEDAPFGGDFNGDGYGDVAIIHKNGADNGANVHVLYGDAGANMFQWQSTFVKSLPAPTWDYNRMKFVTGKFNADAYSDLGIVYQQDDGGAAVHVLYGAPGPGLPLQTLTTQRLMPSSQSWNWSEMKAVSGDFNSDSIDDIAIGAKRADGGMGVHVLTGGIGTAALNNPDTAWRDLPGPVWGWDNIKLAAGPFNGDSNADLAVIYKNAGINAHILNGGAEKFGNTSTFLRALPSPNWNWDQVKLASGQFNDDVYADIALVHQLADGGMGVHALYGKNGVPFQDAQTAVRTLPGNPNNWNWNNTKLAAGAFQNDNWSDIAMLHLNGTSDADVHVLYGNPGSGMFNYDPTFVRKLATTPQGWNWFWMKAA